MIPNPWVQSEDEKRRVEPIPNSWLAVYSEDQKRLIFDGELFREILAVQDPSRSGINRLKTLIFHFLCKIKGVNSCEGRDIVNTNWDKNQLGKKMIDAGAIEHDLKIVLRCAKLINEYDDSMHRKSCWSFFSNKTIHSARPLKSAFLKEFIYNIASGKEKIACITEALGYVRDKFAMDSTDEDVFNKVIAGTFRHEVRDLLSNYIEGVVAYEILEGRENSVAFARQ